MANITSLTITYEGNNVWSYTDNTMPTGKTRGASFNHGTWDIDIVNFTTDTGGILYNGIPYNVIEYVDSIDSGNDFTPTSAKALIVYLKGIGFFDQSSGGGSGATTFIGLTDTPNNYFGYGGQFTVVNEDETGLEFLDIVIPENSTDLQDMPTSLTPFYILQVKADGSGYRLIPIPNQAVEPITFKTTQSIAKGYRWLSGVLTPNTSSSFQTGDIRRGWVSYAPSDPDASWYWMDSGRYKGGDTTNANSYEWGSLKLLAFDTDPDY